MYFQWYNLSNVVFFCVCFNILSHESTADTSFFKRNVKRFDSRKKHILYRFVCLILHMEYHAWFKGYLIDNIYTTNESTLPTYIVMINCSISIYNSARVNVAACTCVWSTLPIWYQANWWCDCKNTFDININNIKCDKDRN